MTGVGFGLSVTICEAVAVHPLASVTVTINVPLVEAVMVSVVAPLLQL